MWSLDFQVMGDAMALPTFWKFLQYSLRMGRRMALDAGEYGLVFLRMALDARYFLVFRLGFVKELSSNLMTGTTVMIGRLEAIGYDRWHVHGMTCQTGLKYHVLGVLLVAFHTTGNQSVGRMALVASQVRVGTRMILHLLALLLVTRETGPRNSTLQFQLQRGVCVNVTA
jgi:hypothetical protein